MKKGRKVDIQKNLKVEKKISKNVEILKCRNVEKQKKLKRRKVDNQKSRR